MTQPSELLFLESMLYVLSAPTGIPIYDFNFRAFFPCRTPWQRKGEVAAVARIGAFDDYEATFSSLLSEGIRLIHSPEEHVRSSQLSGWYSLIEEMTPRSHWFSEPPSAKQIEQLFHWPVFMKGIRQTSRHQRSLSIIRSREQFELAAKAYKSDPILRWQPVVVREYATLRSVDESDSSHIPASFEFRTFWWRDQYVGAGRYWWESRPYDWNADERTEGLKLAQEAARRVNVPFLVVDLAMTAAGRWIVIECNDAQESGYAGVSPIGLWQNILAIERSHAP